MEIGSTSKTQTESPVTENTLEKSGLDREAFLKLFMAQLEHQDPLNPQDPTELASQLAQFSQFEQALRMVDELKGINRRLDDLVAANEAGSATVADPLALLGHQVDFEGNEVSVSSAGNPTPLRFELTERGQAIGISVRDEADRPVGQAVLQGLLLSPGSYEFEADPVDPRLRTPTGSIPLDFARVSSNGGAFEVVSSEDGTPEAFSFEPGRIYRFSVGVTNTSGELAELTTTTSGTVEAVRNNSDGHVVVVNGREMNLSNIIRIR
jgi:flagellar basal-body rod modification protein FlgD